MIYMSPAAGKKVQISAVEAIIECDIEETTNQPK
jgi:hypothetical protein